MQRRISSCALATVYFKLSRNLTPTSPRNGAVGEGARHERDRDGLGMFDAGWFARIGQNCGRHRADLSLFRIDAQRAGHCERPDHHRSRPRAGGQRYQWFD